MWLPPAGEGRLALGLSGSGGHEEGAMKVLVVDDDALSLRVLMALVERLGHEPVAAADGLIAWERFRAEHCRVVISDWIMPGLDGIELLTRVRAMGGAEYTYFIFL